jgi:hypothetical protein
MIHIGIDNGVSGSIGIINSEGNVVNYLHTPIKKELNYTKTKQWLNRIDGIALSEALANYSIEKAFVYIERPMVNPGRFRATVSALRALEATLIVIESLRLPYRYIDSKEWQKALLPAGLEREELKKASLQVGQRLFPQINFKGFTDADGLLIAEHGRQNASRLDSGTSK